MRNKIINAFAIAGQFITIVNPVRISSYTENPKESIKVQYKIIVKSNLPATWLLTYDVLDNKEVVSFIKLMSKNQEIGIFLEVTPKFATRSGVEYHKTGSWHHANSVFLSGYTQNERIKLIETVFEKFKREFGYYPSSMGSWWTDSYSLSYMKEKYNILANLSVADQFSTDGYQVWGTYWSTSYYPSKYHAGVPATSLDTKLDLVTIQWAPRDPLKGYYSSLYSTQDYHTKGLGIDYFESLINLYGKKNKNEFGQITVGLEGDFTPDAYNRDFSKQISLVKRISENGAFKVTTMKDFSNWYRQNFPELSPPHLIENEKITWYQSPKYRIGLIRDSEKMRIIDFRSYHKNLQEPYFISPNREDNLTINIPSYFDEINNPENVWELLSNTDIEFLPEKILLKNKDIKVPEILTKSSALDIRRADGILEIIPKEDWISPREGMIVSDYTAEAIHFFKQKKAILYLITGRGWEHFKKVPYLISQGEIDALFRLSVLPEGKVLVYDNECLQCNWHTDYKPPAFSNRRKYVQKFGKHPIIYNSSVFEVKDQKEAKKEFDKTDTKYIYLVKFEDYIERLPFSPGDLGIEKIYANANAEIWKVKN